MSKNKEHHFPNSSSKDKLTDIQEMLELLCHIVSQAAISG